MEKIKVARNVMTELLKNAERYALETSATATPERIKKYGGKTIYSRENLKFV